MAGAVRNSLGAASIARGPERYDLPVQAQLLQSKRV